MAQAARRARCRLPRLRRRQGLRRPAAAQAQGPQSDVGRVVALDAKKGKIEWSRELASRSESSPLLDGGTLYFGSENGTVYAMDAADGDVRWRYAADGAVKGGLALSDGRLFFGAYGGSVYALRQRDGGELWQASSGGGAFGIGGGNFYSTPAVAYGRVYIGSTNGRMYSFGADSGKVAWSRDTGDYVYASPAVAQVPDAPALVYAGSYSGRFYAWDARTGDERWSRGGYGRISGGATVIGDIVYFADLGNKKTFGSAPAQAARCSSSSAAPTTRSSPTARRSTSPATTPCTRCSR